MCELLHTGNVFRSSSGDLSPLGTDVSNPSSSSAESETNRRRRVRDPLHCIWLIGSGGDHSGATACKVDWISGLAGQVEPQVRMIEDQRRPRKRSRSWHLRFLRFLNMARPSQVKPR